MNLTNIHQFISDSCTVLSWSSRVISSQLAPQGTLAMIFFCLIFSGLTNSVVREERGTIMEVWLEPNIEIWEIVDGFTCLSCHFHSFPPFGGAVTLFWINTLNRAIPCLHCWPMPSLLTSRVGANPGLFSSLGNSLKLIFLSYGIQTEPDLAVHHAATAVGSWDQTWKTWHFSRLRKMMICLNMM